MSSQDPLVARPSEAAECAGSPGEIVLSGAVYKAAPLTLGDYGDWDMMAQADHLRAARMSLDTEADPMRFQALWREAQSYSGRITFNSILAVGVMNSLQGKCRIVWLSVRRGGHAATLEEVFAAARGDMAGLRRAVDEVLTLSGWVTRGAYDADPRGTVLRMVEAAI